MLINLGGDASQPLTPQKRGFRFKINFYSRDIDPAPPLPKNGDYLVPFDALALALNAVTTWNAKTGIAGLRWRGHAINLTVGKKTAVVDGATLPLAAAPEFREGRLLVPAVFLAERLGGRAFVDKKENVLMMKLDVNESININGKMVSIEGPIYTRNSTSYLTVTDLNDALGVKFERTDNDAFILRHRGHTLVLHMDTAKATLDNKGITLEAPVITILDWVYIPIAPVYRKLGIQVGRDEKGTLTFTP
jgi:hypothetical protein